jgi:hypothetical protein
MMPTFLPTTTEPIQKISPPGFPQFLFEWHPEMQKVYIIAVPGRFQNDVFVPGMIGHAQAQILAEHCEHHARFYGFVQTYLRGYRQAEADAILKAKSKITKG